MTISEWFGRNPLAWATLMRHDEGRPSCWVVDSYGLNSSAKWDLWHLSDFAVSTVSSGMIWLIRRTKGGAS